MNNAAPPLWLCLHEAAHAVAYYALGDAVEAPPEGPIISLAIHSDSSGLVQTRATVRDPRYAGICHLAGYVAELRHEHGPQWFPTAADLEANAALTDIGCAFAAAEAMGAAEPAAAVLSIWRETLDLVEREWPGIIAVAAALQARGTLSGVEARAIWRFARPAPARAASVH